MYLYEYETYGDVIEKLPDFLDDVYNRKRLHSALGYLSLDDFEEMVFTQQGKEVPGQTFLTPSIQSYGCSPVYIMLTQVEDAFRCLKSELGLRPVYHQKDDRYRKVILSQVF